MADRVDTVTLNVPLLMRILEWAREEAEDDLALHRLVEQAAQIAAHGEILTMAHYAELIGQSETASVRRRIARLLETAEMRYNPRTGKMRVLDVQKSREAIKSHRKFKGKHLKSSHKREIKLGVKKAMRTNRNRFGRPTRW